MTGCALLSRLTEIPRQSAALPIFACKSADKSASRPHLRTDDHHRSSLILHWQKWCVAARGIYITSCFFGNVKGEEVYTIMSYILYGGEGGGPNV